MVTITGCEYQAKTKLTTSSYWLFNNKFKVNTSNSVQQFSNGSEVAKGSEYWHTFQEIRIVHIRDVGSYRCVIDYNGTNVTSEEVKITRIPGRLAFNISNICFTRFSLIILSKTGIMILDKFFTFLVLRLET